MRRACISIDLDSLYCYQRIFGLAADESDNLIYETGLARFVDLMDEFGFSGTLFTVGRDLTMADNARCIRQLASRGYEAANHTMNHDYGLTRLSKERMLEEVRSGREAIEDAAGVEVTGFRAPGYNVNSRLLEAVADSGHRYDSSAFPCLPYYATKAAVLGQMALRGKESHSILGDPRVMLSPLDPYRIQSTSPWRRGEGPLWEIPISTSPFFRFPFLGSFLIMAGKRWFPILFRMLKAASDCLVLEFHGMDFIDGRADGLDPALLKQPDIAVPWEIKEQLFREVFTAIAQSCEVMPIGELVQALQKEESGV